jgi:hypothetical protein
VSTIVVAIASDHPFSAITNSLRVLVFAGAIMVAGDVVDIVAAAVVVACAGVGVAVAPGVRARQQPLQDAVSKGYNLLVLFPGPNAISLDKASSIPKDQPSSSSCNPAP